MGRFAPLVSVKVVLKVSNNRDAVTEHMEEVRMRSVF